MLTVAFAIPPPPRGMLSAPNIKRRARARSGYTANSVVHVRLYSFVARTDDQPALRRGLAAAAAAAGAAATGVAAAATVAGTLATAAAMAVAMAVATAVRQGRRTGQVGPATAGRRRAAGPPRQCAAAGGRPRARGRRCRAARARGRRRARGRARRL